jgi:hypothetical protein
MYLAYRETKRLHDENAPHRKGWRLGSAAPDLVIKHAGKELEELERSPNNVEELADVFGCLLIYAVKKGWSMEDLECTVLRKMWMRFGEIKVKDL